MKFLLVLFSIIFIFTNVFASQPDYLERVSDVLNYAEVSEEDQKLWVKYLTKFETYDIETIDSFFKNAAKEFNVPVQLLKVIGYLENNWTQIGPSIDYGWGIMHLVENHYCNTLGEASKLINVDKQVLKDDPQQNIRGAAALIALYAKQMKLDPQKLEDWFPAVSKFSGLVTKNLRDQQAYRYYSILKKGVKELNLFDQKVIVSPEKELQIEKFRPVYVHDRTSVDYPKAISNITKYNYTSGRTHDIDTWVVHYIGVGTYAGAISWFHNSQARASAHFCIRHTDGEITQVVRTGDTSWNCGAKEGKFNNQRSIGIEHEVTVTHPEWWKSEIQLKESAKMTAFFCDKYDIPKTHSFPGILGHVEMPGCSTSCPGNCPWDKLLGYINDGTGDDDGDDNGDASTYIKAYVNCPGDTANVRKGPGMDYSVLAELDDGNIIHMIKQEGNWHNILMSDEAKGWIYKTLLIKAVYCKTAIASAELNIKNGPSTGNDVITTIPTGTSMIVLGDNVGWYRVRLTDGTVGYAESSLLEIQ